LSRADDSVTHLDQPISQSSNPFINYPSGYSRLSFPFLAVAPEDLLHHGHELLLAVVELVDAFQPIAEDPGRQKLAFGGRKHVGRLRMAEYAKPIIKAQDDSVRQAEMVILCLIQSFSPNMMSG